MNARILIIEDNNANLDLMMYLLQAFDYTPLIARDGEAGLALVRQVRPDLILCDVQIPKLDGYQVADWLRRDPVLGNIPLVAVTAYAMVGDRDKLLAAGFDGYLSKPINPESFVGQVEEFLPLEMRSKGRQPAESAHSAPVVARLGTKRATILLVDNAPTDLDLYRSILQSCGYTIVCALSVEEALRLARRMPLDLILSDLHMPRLSGFDLVRAVRDDPRLAGLRVVIHSATVMSPKDRLEALELGANDFIDRSLEPLQLLARIEACLEKP